MGCSSSQPRTLTPPLCIWLRDTAGVKVLGGQCCCTLTLTLHISQLHGMARAVLAAQQALQAATLAGPPGGWLFQLLWAGCFAAQAALVATVCSSLVVRPVLDALDASSVRHESHIMYIHISGIYLCLLQ